MHVATPPSEACLARYTTDAAQSIPNSSETIVDFEDQEYDTDGAVTVGAGWNFECPVGKDGYYLINVMVWFASHAWGANQYAYARIGYNGVPGRVIAGWDSGDGGTSLAQLSGSDMIYLSAGDTIDICLFQNHGAALVLDNNSDDNHIAISRVR
jgi:hypothetical protein